MPKDIELHLHDSYCHQPEKYLYSLTRKQPLGASACQYNEVIETTDIVDGKKYVRWFLIISNGHTKYTRGGYIYTAQQFTSEKMAELWVAASEEVKKMQDETVAEFIEAAGKECG